MELLRLVGVCLKVGALVFGGGLVMVPLLEPDVVQQHQWVTHDEFMDAVALGQVTPGPLLVTATFIGYKVGSDWGPLMALAGAVAATVAMFLPSFAMTIACSRQLKRLQRSPRLQAALKGVQAGVVGLIAAAAAVLVDQGALLDWRGGVLALVALIALVRFKADASVVVLCGGTVGLLLWL
jgi:chromate transporter